MRRVQSERGAGLIEYAILASLIAIIAIVTVRVTGLEVKREFCVNALSFRYAARTDMPDFRARTARGLPASTSLYDYSTGACYSASSVMPALRGTRLF